MLPLITFRPFRPTFITVYHKPMQNIPEIWREKTYCLPLHSKEFKNKKVKREKS